MPTEIVKYVDPDGGILADYTSLQAAITAEKAIRSDLVARDEVLKLMCISSAGSPDTTPILISGFTTDATRNIIVQGDNQSGIWSTSHYRLVRDITTSKGSIVDVYTQYVVFDSIQFEIIGTNTGGESIVEFKDSVIGTVKNSIIVFNGSTATFNGLYTYNGGLTSINNIIYNCEYGIVSYIGNTYIYNTTIYNCENGYYRASGNVLVVNSIAQNCTNGFFGTFAVGSNNNISDLAGDAPGANSLNSTTVNFADAANGDFRLLTGSPGVDQGVDLSADANYPFNTAIDNTLRPQGGAWDIGAFEYVEESEEGFNFKAAAVIRQSNSIYKLL